MTKFQKQMLTIAAAGALTAVTALPAMAFENQFNGTFALKTYLSNFENGSGTATVATRDKTKANNFTDQRLRVNYTAKASDDLKLIVQLEMNTLWGNTTTNPTSNSAGGGGGVDTDGLNVATRHAYLDFNMGKSVNVKAGLQPYQDIFKGVYAGSIDLPMAQVAYSQGGYKLNLGYSRFRDDVTGLSANTFKGDRAADLYLIENTYAFNKDTKVSLGYYLNVDNVNEANGLGQPKKINTLGLAAETKVAGIELSGFAAMQNGYQKNTVNTVASTTYQGWAANVAAKMKAGNGVARTAFLFTSGNNKTGGFNGGWQTLSNAGNTTSVAQNSYVEGGMMILTRNPAQGGTNTDGYIRKPVTNIALATIGYDANLTEKVYLNGNVGFAWVPASHYLTNGTYNATPNGGDFMGTEMNLEAGYKLYKNLTLKAQAAYVVLGAAYKNVAQNNAGVAADPANPWTMRLGAFYSF